METDTVKSYLYQEYQDDLDLRAFVDAYNTMTQQYLNMFTHIHLPIYTGLHNGLLDLIASGVYGLPRPVISVSSGAVYGIATYGVESYGSGTASSFAVSDDIYKRILTWKLFRGDGFIMSIPWLKNRVKRFLIGVNGTCPSIDNTAEIGVTISPLNEISITIHYPSDEASVTLFRECLASGQLDMPWQYVYTATSI
jgi:hypothetical protein